VWYLTTFVYKSMAAERLGSAFEIPGGAESVECTGSTSSAITIEGQGLELHDLSNHDGNVWKTKK
jgi:hypothetical protein